MKLLIVKILCLSKSKTFNSWNNGSVGWLQFLNKIFLTAFCKFFLMGFKLLGVALPQSRSL